MKTGMETEKGPEEEWQRGGKVQCVGTVTVKVWHRVK